MARRLSEWAAVDGYYSLPWLPVRMLQKLNLVDFNIRICLGLNRFLLYSGPIDQEVRCIRRQIFEKVCA